MNILRLLNNIMRKERNSKTKVNNVYFVYITTTESTLHCHEEKLFIFTRVKFSKLFYYKNVNIIIDLIITKFSTFLYKE